MRGFILVVCLIAPMIAACGQGLPALEQAVRAVDDRNAELGFALSGKPGDVVRLDIVDIQGQESGTDFFRVFWNTAYRLHADGFGLTTMELASFGELRFIVPAEVVAAYGSDYPDQNPVYLIRTFPAQAQRPDGSPAFPERRGGFLGVTAQQMEDFGAFMQGWVIEPYLQRQDPAEPIEHRDSEAF